MSNLTEQLKDKDNFDINKLFVDSCEEGKLDIVQHIYENNFTEHLNVKNGFLLACLEGKIEIIKYLFSVSLEIKTNQYFHERGFNLAYGEKHLDIIRHLIFEANIDVTEKIKQKMNDRPNGLTTQIASMFNARELTRELQETLSNHDSQPKNKVKL